MQQLPTLLVRQMLDVVGNGVQTDATTPNNVGSCWLKRLTPSKELHPLLRPKKGGRLAEKETRTKILLQQRRHAAFPPWTELPRKTAMK